MPSEAGPEANLVLVTRPATAAAATAQALRDRGFVPLLAPLMTIKSLPAELPEPATLQAILVTSARALPALGPAYRKLPLFAVGGATAAQALAAGQLCVFSADGDATDLQRLIQAQCDPQRGTLLLLSGEGEGARLEAGLATRFQVEQRFVYAATPVAALPAAAAAALAGQRLTAALFYAPGTARVFAALAEAAGLRDTVRCVAALAISAATAAALAPLPWRQVRVASRPNQDELLALLR